jgi:uncharacterized Zn finger protein
VIERGHHDMGGLPAGRVERTEHDYADWERRVDALSVLLNTKVSVDERRKNIEALPPQDYDAMSYYERWVVSLGQALIQRGIITTEELGRKMEEVCSRNS